MKLILYIFLSVFSVLAANSQTKSTCLVLDGKTDTVSCDGRKIQIELSFCESNGLFQDGVATDMNGKEEFCFYYNYDKKSKLKSITFWTFQWKNGGYVTKDKIGVLKIRQDKQELIIKRGFTLNKDFIKLVTKIKFVEHHSDWEKYDQMYPPEKFEFDHAKMTYNETTNILLFTEHPAFKIIANKNFSNSKNLKKQLEIGIKRTKKIWFG